MTLDPGLLQWAVVALFGSMAVLTVISVYILTVSIIMMMMEDTAQPIERSETTLHFDVSPIADGQARDTVEQSQPVLIRDD